jgi:hypothetical protein
MGTGALLNFRIKEQKWQKNCQTEIKKKTLFCAVFICENLYLTGAPQL